MGIREKFVAALNRLDYYGAPPADSDLMVNSSNTSYELLDQSEGLGHDMNGARKLTLADLRLLVHGHQRALVGDPYLDMLSDWQDVRDDLAAAKERELELRLLLFRGTFPNPKEGTNSHRLPDGRTIKATYSINRRVDEAAVPAVLEQLKADGVANFDKIVCYKIELAKREWNSLGDAAKLTFSPALVATPGTPQLEVVAAKKGREA